MISHKWLYLADIFEHQIMLMNNLRNFPPVTLGIFQSTLLQEERRDAGSRFRKPYGNFNPRSYKRSDLRLQFWCWTGKYFNPRSYKRSDMVTLFIIRFRWQFQSTLLQEERPHSIYRIKLSFYFNPRSYKRSDKYFKSNIHFNCYFNPRSYKRSDHTYIYKDFYIDISIHAPTRGATSISKSSSAFCCISIHAPTRGATLYRCATLCIIFYFNPRSYKRSDQPSA